MKSYWKFSRGGIERKHSGIHVLAGDSIPA